MAEPSHDAWTVLPHGPIEALEDGLWRVEGSLPANPLRRVMTVARLESGDLVVHNPVALDAPAMTELDAFGRVAFLVVPNGWHRLDLRAYRGRYPAARVLAPPGARKRVALVAPDVEGLEALPVDGRVSLETMAGVAEREAVMRVAAGGGLTIVLGDAVFNMPHLAGVRGFVLRHVTGSSGGPRTSRVARLFMIEDRRALADHLERLAAAGPRRVIVAHHETIATDPAGALRRVAASLR